MASDARIEKTFKADYSLPGMWDMVPNLPVNPRTSGRPETLNESDPPLGALVDNRMVAVAITSPDKRWVRVNDKWCEMIGYSREELASVDWAAITHPDDLAADLAQFARLLSGEIREYVLEKRFIRKGGQILHAEIYVTAVREADGALKYAVGLGVDITERKRAEQTLTEMKGKLIEAQEEERARIGRELHDDIAQRLSLLCLEVDLAQRNPSDIGRALLDVRNQLDAVARDVQSLSHELHASNVEYLGAVNGIKSWCTEFGARYKILIDFSSSVHTLLPRAVGIYLFRVVQEALHNVLKHSGANRAEVNLAERGEEIHLVIRDAGQGFDPREVRGGLGLISMRERIQLIGGTLTIESGPMRGTSILVRVPLAANREAKARRTQ